jgi:Na+/H+-dicarboxylate symporter
MSPFHERLARWSASPWVLLGGVGLGALIGVVAPRAAAALAPVGEVYLDLLTMCVLPVMMTALVSAVARALNSGAGLDYLRRLAAVFAVALLAAGAVGVTVGTLVGPGGGLSPERQAMFGARVLEAEALDAGEEPRAAGLVGFVRGMVPENPFQAATAGNSLPLVVFCLLVGLALGGLRNERASTALMVTEAAYEALLKMVGWVMYGLPIGLATLVAERVASTGGDVILAMGRFVLALYLGVLVLLAVFAALTWVRVRGSPLAVLRAVRGPLLVGLGTSSNFATIPSTLEAAVRGLRRERDGANLLVPLGVSLCLPGSALYFALASLFVAQLYGVSLGVEQYAVVVVGSALAAVAASDAPGMAGISTVAVVLDPLGLPVSVAVILLSVIDPLVEPAITVADVQGNLTATALVVGKADGA